MTELPQSWSYAVLKEIAGVLADTNEGLTGREIGDLLHHLRMEDPIPTATKRERLAKAFIAHQDKYQSSKGVINFIVMVMEPVRYRTQPELFSLRQDQLNERLAFVGLQVNDEGKVVSGAVAQTLDEASRIATSIRDELCRRKCHPEVLRYCSLEVLKKAHFHACLEATKSIFDRIRDLSGASDDGAALVDAALALGKSGVPMLAINSLRTQTEKDEQTGLANLVKGLSGLYRNPTAHDPRLNRTVSEDELLEVLTVVSMVHRRLDGASVSSGGSS
ncbi:TIGR02391 family protein [Actinomyces ruminis]|uniref:TIGR02391 family protein n=1 Tax=Actinomyces ruminis TaxID=1937003 RepID=A0ABX4MCM5_9ACTO|nr:TIGR02391 family protein [Actinomyces ruminis]PHP53232.1 TIGR02391 family protein [Actinomyces ruminis]